MTLPKPILDRIEAEAKKYNPDYEVGYRDGATTWALRCQRLREILIDQKDYLEEMLQDSPEKCTSECTGLGHKLDCRLMLECHIDEAKQAIASFDADVGGGE